MNDFIYYKVGDKTAKVSSDRQQFFEEKYPDAKILYSYEGRTAAVPLGQRDSFLSKYGADKVTFASFDEEKKDTPAANDGMILDEQPSFASADDDPMTRREKRQARREERANNDNVTLRETIKNAYGVNRATLPKYVIDLANAGLKTRALSPEFNISDIVEGVTGKSVYDPNAPLNRASQWLGERAEEKSKAADPTHGEKGYWELLKDFQLGKIGKKAIGQTIQSAPMMAAASSGFGSLLLGAGMSASEFEDTKRERPEIDDWKNLLYSVGTTATEFAVERLGGPLKNLLSGGAKKLTKEAAEEIIEKVTKESEKSIAERILKRIGKEGLEEGGEEVITYAANDALGEALDRLDGQQDFGFAAQWEAFKEENPEATKWDFAKNKGKEILEAFLGGGFAGAMMSSASTPVSEFGNKQARDSFQRAKEVGAAMDYRDMYDVEDEVQQATDKASKSFVDANGEQTISAEFIETLSADDAFNLSQSEDVPFEQRTALMELSYAKAKQEGLERKLDERILVEINANKALIEGASQNGKVTIGQVEGMNVYVVGGTVNNGKVTLPDGQDGPIVVLDTQTGDKIYVRTDDITGAGVYDAKALGHDIAQSWIDADNAAREQARNTMSPRAKANAVQPYKGKKILVDVGNGVTEVYVQEITPNGEVIIKGKKGDLGGQSFLTLNTSTFYDSIYRDGDGNPVVTDAGPEVEETPVEGAPQNVTENDDFRDFTGTIVVNDTPLNVEVVSQDNPSNSIVYKYTDANGVERRGSSTIGDFKAAIQAAESTTQKVDTTPTETTDVTPTEEVPETAGEVAPETPVEETPTETPVEEAPVDETPAPQTTDWKALFEANPNEYLRELQRQYGDRAAEIIRDEIAALEEELEALEKNRGKDMNERMANLDKKGELKLNIGILKELLWDLQKNPAPQPEPQPVAETPVDTPAPVEEAPVAETPAEETPVVETPIEPAPETPVTETPIEEAPVAEAPVEETPTDEAPVAETPTPAEPTPAPAPQPEPQPKPVEPKPAPKTEDGAIQRMFKAFKAQVAKLAKNAKIKDFCDTDDIRPALTGIFKKDGYEVASNGHILAKIKAKYPAEQEGKIISPKTGQEINAKFPDANAVIDGALKYEVIDANIDDIIAYARTAEEIKKGFDKKTDLYIRIGNGVYKSDLLLRAALMAKQNGLTEIHQSPAKSGRNMAITGANGTVLITPVIGTDDHSIIDITNGQIKFSSYTTIKTPKTLKGIETARETLAAVLPNIEEDFIDNLKKWDMLKLINGKVVYFFPISDITDVTNKANDPNTFAALDAIRKNGLEIPMSQSEIAKIFPEAVPAAPATPVNPVAPKSVANPIQEAQKRERSLATQLKRVDISPEQKRDMAFNAGKAIGDLFATREEYEAYAENATDLGEYNSDFERGVDESFANRGQNSGDSQGESVPLGTDQNGDNDGKEGEDTQGYGDGDAGGRTTNDGDTQGNPTTPKTTSIDGDKGKGRKKVDKYPARKGNATKKLLIDTFGFDEVTISNEQKAVLNTIYDFMMGMSKMLGISPKSIGNGGVLKVGNLRSNASAAAKYGYKYRRLDEEVVHPILQFKYAKLNSIAHEWWHALDHVLAFFNTGRGVTVASELSESRFDGRKEVYDAVMNILAAIKDSGHTRRLASIGYSYSHLNYLLEPTEQIARAFDEYIAAKFADAGIIIEGLDHSMEYSGGNTQQPTPEEMEVIAPAFDKLFEVLKEKAGKKPDTSVLYHIGNEVDQMEAERNVSDEAKQLAAQAVAMQLAGNEGIDFAAATDEETEQMMEAAGAGAEFMVADDKPVFVSNAAVAVMGIKQEKATPEQWLKMIEKAGGLKAGEDKWMLLSDWLKSSDKKTLTKQEVLDYIKENEIQIEEVNYAEVNYFAEDKKLISVVNDEFLALKAEAEEAGEWSSDAGYIAFEKMKDKYGDDFGIAFDVLGGELYVANRAAASRVTGVDLGVERAIDETRIGYTTEGLSNYKEIALVVPTIESWNEEDEVHFGDAGEGRAVAWIRFGETEVTVQDAAQQRLNEIYDRLVELEMKVSSSTGITMEEYEERARLREERDRLQEIEPKTQKVLVIDEIQSKRHQEGREKGYKISIEKAEAEMEKFMQRMHEKYDFSSSTPFADVFSEEEMREYARLDMQRHRAYFGHSSVPDAPFDKNWSELAMKRMLRYAAENGYDAIAWTKGEQQAERYDIGQSIKTIEKGREYDNGTRYTLYDNSDTGRSIFVKDGIITDAYFDELKGKPLSEAVGKEVAETMLSMEEGDVRDAKGMIGGEGMKGFYDKILPAFMNKYGKKWGVKVSDITLPNVEEAGRVMHSVPVNEAMKDSVMDGQPMFMKRPNGKVYGWAQGNSIRYTKDGFNPNTLTHEYTHLWAKAMMLKNPKGWKSVKDLLRDTPVWNEVMNDANYSDIHSDEDLVASEVLSRISGREGAAKLEQMAQQMIDEAKGTMRKLEARGLVQRIKDALNEFWSWVGVELFGIEKFESVEQVADRVLWDLMNQTDLNAPYAGEVAEITDADGKTIASTNGKGRVQFSIGTWEDGGRDYLVNWLNNDKDLAEDEKADIIARMDEFYENAKKYTDTYVPFGNWSDAAVKYDQNGNPIMSVIKANGDYAMNLDFSLVCKKRRPLNRLLRTLINRNAFGSYSLKERELAEINWILQEHGFEVACALCFVDSKRYRVTSVADVFAALYNKMVKALAPEGASIAHFNYNNNPNVEVVENGIDTLPDNQLNWEEFDRLASKFGPNTVEGKVAKFLRENPSQRRLVDATDFIEAEGFEAVKANNPSLLSLYNSKKGQAGPKASFGDVQYLNDILKNEKKFDVEKAYAVGGVRLQSFSDFVPHMYFDYMQLFAELAAKKLPAHAYTKEVLFAKIFGMTGMKINMSLVPAVAEDGIAPGLDKDGNYVWADAVKDKDGNVLQQGQTFPYDEAVAIQNAEGYSKNCGIIAVGISDEHILKMLGDENIPYIIPYHKSALNAVVARMTKIDTFKNYEKDQNTRDANGAKLAKGTPDFNFNEYLHTHKDATPQQAAQAYLDWCRENNYIPKFSQFAYHPNYYKLLADFNTIDLRTGEYAPQGAVKMQFPTEDSAFGDVESLIKQGLQEDADSEAKMDAETEQLADEVENRLKEIGEEPKMSQKKKNEHLAKLADERMEKLRERADATAEEYGDGILSRSGDITPEMDAEYLAAVEAGDMETAQRMVNEAAKLAMPDTKVVDENGNPMIVYHGSPYGAITVFNHKRQRTSGLKEFGSYFATNKKVADMYRDQRSLSNELRESIETEIARLREIQYNIANSREYDAIEDEIKRLRDALSGKVYATFLNITSPKTFDAKGKDGWAGWHELKQDVGYDIKSGREAIEAITGNNDAAVMSEQYDGIIAKNIADIHSTADVSDLLGDVFLVWNPTQIKSAEAVTYDDNGNVIPLSERFNPENPDIRYRTINEGETDLEFVQSAVADFLSQYKSPVPMTAVDVNDKAAVEVAIGFEVDELSDESYQMLVDKVNNGGRSIYVADTKRIAIFADARNEISADVDESSFHEITHALADKNPAILELGEWLWNNADKGVRKKVKDIVLSNGYPAEQYHNEMLARFTGVMLALGGAGKVMPILPTEQHKHWNYILNEIGYDPERDDESRRERHSVDSSRRRSNRQMASATLPDNGDARNVKEARQNEAVGRLVGTARSFAIEHAVNEEAAKLGVKVTYKTREEMPAGHKNDKGYYNTKTGEIVVCTENASSISDAIQTILHEAVAHKGLRQLMGDRFNEFINRVYDSLDAETKAKVDALAEKSYNGNKAVAMEEYLASLAETEDFAKNSVWDKVKSIFEDIINAILGRNDIKIGDNELRYILRASYNHMVNPRGMDSLRGWAQDQMMREEYKINEASPELLSRTGVDDVAFTSAQEVYEKVAFISFKEVFDSIRNATGIKGKWKAVKTGWQKIWNEIQMENQDAQQYVIAGIESIQKETGNLPIEDYENYLLQENQSQSRSRVEIDYFFEKLFSPIIDHINDIITIIMETRGLDAGDKKKRVETYRLLVNYMIAKHGIERNELFRTTKGEDRDYSGLTALFGLDADKYADAEAMAQDLIDLVEALVGNAMIKALWDKINAATTRTLRHSYESGIISRSQYDQISKMFKYYIPLRGFDETMAEDVYEYARYDGNSFQPAVLTAKGRTSVAFDPLAVIMNMAQSEIIQGNKNRVKQALYNYVVNRPNTLLTIRDCWYVKDANTGKFVEAYPDLAHGETWEQFEERMQQLAEQDMAKKRKKGLDIGYRFVKPKDKNEHYIHVMINGVERAIIVNGNPRLAEGVNGIKDHSKEAIKAIKKVNRTASQLYTNYNYKFGGKNFIRDFIWAETIMSIKESPTYMLRYLGKWATGNPVTISSLMKKYKSDSLDMSIERHRLFKEFVENGGQTGYVYIDELDRQKNRIDRAVAKMTKVGNKVTNNVAKAGVLLDIIQYVNECIELSARFATYATSRTTKDKNGNYRSIVKAVDDSKAITTNFNRKGAQSGRGLIGGIASFMGSWNYFYNAAVQGVQLIKGAYDKHPAKTIAAMSGWVGLGFTLPFIIGFFRDDDEEEDIYWNLPEYERKNNICIPFGNGKVTLTIPLSPSIRELYACGVTLSDALFNKDVDKDATILSLECASLLAKGFLPANPAEGLSAGLTPAENLLMFGTPDVADPVAEVIINKDWTGSPIENRTSYNEGAPHYKKVIGKDNWKAEVGEKLYKSNVDNLDSPRDYNISAWEHVFSGASGGIGVLVKDITNIVDWVTSWEAPERLNDVPVARTFLSSSAMDDEKFVNNIYWKMDDIYKQKTKVMSTVYGLTPSEAFKKGKGKKDVNLMEVYDAKSFRFLKRYYELNADIKSKYEDIQKMPTRTEAEKNKKALAEQDLFNMRSELVYELLEYEIE